MHTRPMLLLEMLADWLGSSYCFRSYDRSVIRDKGLACEAEKPADSRGSHHFSLTACPQALTVVFPFGRAMPLDFRES